MARISEGANGVLTAVLTGGARTPLIPLGRAHARTHPPLGYATARERRDKTNRVGRQPAQTSSEAVCHDLRQERVVQFVQDEPVGAPALWRAYPVSEERPVQVHNVSQN